MLPVGSHSGLTRPAEFVKEEWATYFDNGRVDSISDGWKGVAYANYALVDAKTAWNFFSQPNFNSGWLDGGASLSWYLAMSAMLGGA
jgi:endo-1,3(4)-beta-glucanase